MYRARPLLTGAVTSLGVHLLVTLALLSLPATRATHKLAVPDKSTLVEVDPLEAPEGTGLAPRRGRAPRDAERAEAGGRTSEQNIDALDPGQGGDRTGALATLRLLTEDDRVLLFDSPLNNLAAGQLQRIRTARDRATLEPRRATPNPHDQAFLASGDGVHRERRPVAPSDAASGARRAPEASLRGGLPSVERAGGRSGGAGDRAAPSPTTTAAASADDRGAPQPSPGQGILNGRGQRRGRAADVAFGRPSVDRGPAATEAEQRDARVRDDQDSEELASTLYQSWVDATARRSEREGPGRGGAREGGAPGTGGGAREGGRAAAYGTGDGAHPALDTSDARYVRWVRESSRRVHDALRYPRERALALDQGTTILMLYVNRDGTLSGRPRLVRTSGFDDLDAAARAAVRQATPFGAVPPELAPGISRIPIRLPVEFSNPMVR